MLVCVVLVMCFLGSSRLSRMVVMLLLVIVELNRVFIIVGIWLSRVGCVVMLRLMLNEVVMISMLWWFIVVWLRMWMLVVVMLLNIIRVVLLSIGLGICWRIVLI